MFWYTDFQLLGLFSALLVVGSNVEVYGTLVLVFILFSYDKCLSFWIIFFSWMFVAVLPPEG